MNLNYLNWSYFIFISVVIRICYGDNAARIREVLTLRSQMPHNPTTTTLCTLQQMLYFIGGSVKYALDPLEIRTYENDNGRRYFAIKKPTQMQPEVSFWDFDVESFLHFYNLKIRLNLLNNDAPHIVNTIIIVFYDKSWAQYFYQLAATNYAKGQELAYGATILKTYQRYEKNLIGSTADDAANIIIFRKDTTGDGTVGGSDDESELHAYHTAPVRSYSLLTPAEGENPIPQLIFSSQKFTIGSEVKEGNKIFIMLTDLPNLIFVLHFDAVNGQPQQFFNQLCEDWDNNTPTIPDDEVNAILNG